MPKVTNYNSISGARLCRLSEACEITRFGKNFCRQWLDEIGATRKIGRMVRFDTDVIYRAIDDMASTAAVESETA